MHQFVGTFRPSYIHNVPPVRISHLGCTVWTALEREGLGCNLQHYNFSETFRKDVLETWNLPQTWNLRAQLVFGQPSATSADGGLPEREKEKSFKPIEGERLLRFG